MKMGLSLLLLFLFGCARPLPPELPLPSRNESQLQAHLDMVTSRYQSLQSSARIEVVTGNESFAASQVLFVQRPAQLRSEILFGPFATPVMSLSADQDQISVYQPLQGTFAQGSASVANIVRYTRMPLRVEDLVGMILVAPPRFPFEKSSVFRIAAGDRLVLVAAGGVEQRFTFDAAGNLLQAAYFLGENLQLQADYSGFDAQAANFPQKLRVSMPERQVVATMTFSDSVINVPIPPHNFVLKVPAGMKVQSLP
jgi:outer membrane lipoprotein-sorting protein